MYGEGRETHRRLSHRQQHARPRVVVDIVKGQVADHADDGKPRGIRLGAELEAALQRVLPRPVAVGETLIDHDHRQAVSRVACVRQPTRQRTKTVGLRKAVIDPCMCHEIVRGRLRATLDQHFIVAAHQARQGVGRGRSEHAGFGAQSFRHALKEFDLLGAGRILLWKYSGARSEQRFARRVEADIEPRTRIELPPCHAGADQKHARKCHLGHDQHSRDPRCAATGTTVVDNGALEFEAGRAQARHQACSDRRDRGNADAEGRHAWRHREFDPVGRAVAGFDEGPHRIHARPMGDHQRQGRRDEGQHQGFRQQRDQQARAPGTQRVSQGQLPTALTQQRQLQVGDIGTGHQQHRQCRHQQDGDDASRMRIHETMLGRMQAHLEVAARLRRLLLQTLPHALQFHGGLVK